MLLDVRVRNRMLQYVTCLHDALSQDFFSGYAPSLVDMCSIILGAEDHITSATLLLPADVTSLLISSSFVGGSIELPSASELFVPLAGLPALTPMSELDEMTDELPVAQPSLSAAPHRPSDPPFLPPTAITTRADQVPQQLSRESSNIKLLESVTTFSPPPLVRGDSHAATMNPTPRIRLLLVIMLGVLLAMAGHLLLGS